MIFDWDTWNRKELELACKQRKLLPDEYALYYSPSFEDYEDYENLEKPPILISKAKTEL